MKAFLAYLKISFKSHTVYRVQFIFGIIKTCIQIFINCSIWKALYGNNTEVSGITYMMVTTNFVLSLAMSASFGINDFAIQQKLWDGSIATEMLKPIDLRVNLLARDLGEILFNLLANFAPSVLISIFFIGILPPESLINFMFYLISIILGFAVLWALSTIVQMTAFWIMNVWSVVTIKNVFINILSGMMIPLWFLPSSFREIIELTPFETIYYIPVNIYLGRLSSCEIAASYFKQIVWFIVLFIIGNWLWNIGKKRIFVQGG